MAALGSGCATGRTCFVLDELTLRAQWAWLGRARSWAWRMRERWVLLLFEEHGVYGGGAQSWAALLLVSHTVIRMQMRGGGGNHCNPSPLTQQPPWPSSAVLAPRPHISLFVDPQPPQRSPGPGRCRRGKEPSWEPREDPWSRSGDAGGLGWSKQRWGVGEAQLNTWPFCSFGGKWWIFFVQVYQEFFSLHCQLSERPCPRQASLLKELLIPN